MHGIWKLASILGKERDALVQWCHGAVGHILLLVQAYEVFHNVEYLSRAQLLAHEVVRPRGLLRKGDSLCHGVSGHAYTFLAVYRAIERGGEIKDEEIELWLQEHGSMWSSLTIREKNFAAYQTIHSLCSKAWVNYVACVMIHVALKLQ